MKKHENLAASLLMTVAVFAVFSIGWDFYYDLNDDVLIKDVLSGVYSGSPSGYTMQLLYPLGFVLSVLYRALSLPVFGIFLVLCQFGAVWAVGYQSAECCMDPEGKGGSARFRSDFMDFGIWDASGLYPVHGYGGNACGGGAVLDIDGKAAQMVCARPILACLLSQNRDSALTAAAGMCGGAVRTGTGMEKGACGCAVFFPVRDFDTRDGGAVCGRCRGLFCAGMETVPAVF